MRCDTNHAPIEYQEATCPVCRAHYERDLLRSLISDLGVTLLNALERGAVVLNECNNLEAARGTRH